jgi:hypothetical protein
MSSLLCSSPCYQGIHRRSCSLHSDNELEFAVPVEEDDSSVTSFSDIDGTSSRPTSIDSLTSIYSSSTGYKSRRDSLSSTYKLSSGRRVRYRNTRIPTPTNPEPVTREPSTTFAYIIRTLRFLLPCLIARRLINRASTLKPLVLPQRITRTRQRPTTPLNAAFFLAFLSFFSSFETRTRATAPAQRGLKPLRLPTRLVYCEVQPKTLLSRRLHLIRTAMRFIMAPLDLVKCRLSAHVREWAEIDAAAEDLVGGVNVWMLRW